MQSFYLLIQLMSHIYTYIYITIHLFIIPGSNQGEKRWS